MIAGVGRHTVDCSRIVLADKVEASSRMVFFSNTLVSAETELKTENNV